ncbi:sulfurtransferase TusA family protein [Vagococcus hydrophili]|uniref:Sulfurtransferase TusA family protein n=1 Tax=Vagococcus hydrophili TaxID=2714947 RepID=A0A6G8ATF0_9ENTE|nr:sulfurtransferase TusA family protein [Vagococcus hydrophili]QIL48203.1 sulfurtransferase TusA family protein [Vagococcus hydrophili]
MTKEINTNGLDCPIPLIKLKEALKESQDGEVIKVLFTCPEAVENLPNYAEEQGHEVLDFKKLGKKGWEITVKK